MATPSLPQVNISEHGKVRYLHLGSVWVQGSMDTGKPNAIHLDYVQRMQAWLLFVEPDTVSQLHAMQLGLGAAALTKNCHKVLGMQTTAIELNPQVIGACRSWFALSADDDRLSVVLGDAAEVVAHTYWRGQIDVLHVDLYDHEAAAPVLDDADFYAQSPPKRATPWCWRRPKRLLPIEHFYKPELRRYKRALACPHRCGSRFLSRWRFR